MNPRINFYPLGFSYSSKILKEVVMEDFYELLKEYLLNDKNYTSWRKEHIKIFGEIFSCAFAENVEAQIHLTAALIDISKRNFEAAMTKLNILESICLNDYDCAVMSYFLGLNHELIGNEDAMNEYYEKLCDSNASFVFPLAFHPYYRTAKFAQRDSECGKAIFYYQKALSFYNGVAYLHPKSKSSISQIIYDIATLCLYMHKYEECEKFLTLSNTYDGSENQQRTYVTAILYAVQGRIDDSHNLLTSMSSFLRMNCEPIIEAITAKNDLHYCVVKQDTSDYANFWNSIIARKSNFEKLIDDNNYSECQKNVSDILSTTLSFMKRQIACRIESSDDMITVFCKNYYVKTLIEEYKSLFSMKPKELNNWKFVSVNDFEKY